MKKISLAMLLVILSAGIFTSCKDKTADADNARIERMDSIEKDLDQSIERLEDKTEELEKLVNDLDTTSNSKN